MSRSQVISGSTCSRRSSRTRATDAPSRPLVERAGLDDPAVRIVGEIVHDLDLKDAKFGREETAGIAGLIGGIVLAHSDDEQRLARGAAILDDLYRHFRNKKRG